MRPDSRRLVAVFALLVARLILVVSFFTIANHLLFGRPRSLVRPVIGILPSIVLLMACHRLLQSDRPRVYLEELHYGAALGSVFVLAVIGRAALISCCFRASPAVTFGLGILCAILLGSYLVLRHRRPTHQRRRSA